MEPIDNFGIQRFRMEPIKDFEIRRFWIEPIKDIGIRRFRIEPIKDIGIRSSDANGSAWSDLKPKSSWTGRVFIGHQLWTSEVPGSGHERWVGLELEGGNLGNVPAPWVKGVKSYIVVEREDIINFPFYLSLARLGLNNTNSEVPDRTYQRFWNSEVPDGTYQRFWNSEVLDRTYQRFWNSEVPDGTYQRYWNLEVPDRTYQRYWNSELCLPPNLN
ncbi:hypothetical protein RhiirA4_472091 [Rhizophagus irregularis]|uniref:Uncharacterized protein n=1 Tax=Rhizophagus irregularis TaxID=588596 RepID=A0A2I1H4C8_9GLOM|nr:hypothetical protein RhiirA4_472091 [Rhizophagus irregularis]